LVRRRRQDRNLVATGVVGRRFRSGAGADKIGILSPREWWAGDSDLVRAPTRSESCRHGSRSASPALGASSSASSRVAASVLITLLLIGTAAQAVGDEPVRPKSTNPASSNSTVDAFDDPLPAGAVARMGSTRFRHTGLADFVWPAGGKTAVTIGSDEVVRWWDPETGHRTKAVALKKTQARQFAISPDGKLVAACSPGVTTIFDANSGEVLGELEVAKWGTGQLGFSPDGKMLYVTQHDGRINVWDWRAKKPHAISLGAPQWGADSSFHLHFSPDGKHFVAGVSWQQPLAVFSTATWEKEQ